jgi:thiol-disulfide isomerase/thioredoxin
MHGMVLSSTLILWVIQNLRFAVPNFEFNCVSYRSHVLISPLSLSVIYVSKRDFLQKHTDKLVVIKYFSTSCKACQALAPKYKAFVRNHNNRVSHLDDVVFAEMASNYHGHSNNNDNNKKKNMDFFERDLQLTAFHQYKYILEARSLNQFACPPNMFPMFKRKVALWMDRRMRPGTTDKVLAQDSEGTIECPPQS